MNSEVEVLKTASKTVRPALLGEPLVKGISTKGHWAFVASIFLGAVQLFLLELMLAKMLLPRFGGAPAVWTTCVVFFQSTLLAGYAYAHWLTTRWRSRHQVALHFFLLVSCLAFLPIGISDWLVPTSADRPALSILAILTLTAGLPFLMVSSTTPLLQRWFAASGFKDSDDPYYFYAASNAGSLLALVAYPVLVEPFFSLPIQSGIWAVSFCLWFVMVAVCARQVWNAKSVSPKSDSRYSKRQDVKLRMKLSLNTNSNPPTSPDESGPGKSGFGLRISNLTRVGWLVLAFVPSSLMLGCTSFLCSDVASFPLMWIAPLALYLLSFVIAFANGTPAWVHRVMVWALPAALGLQLLTEGKTSLGTLLVRHLTTLFVAAMVCHGELAKRRPATRWLTEYYLWIAAGGALGSFFNALVAPHLFSWVVEYPLALSLAAFLLPPLFPGAKRPMLCIANRVVPIFLGGCVGAIFLLNRHQFVKQGQVIHEERSFFGVYRIVRGSEGNTNALLHGQVWHGMQVDSDDRLQRRVPLTYYFPTSPIGQVFFAFPGPRGKARTALIGLGIGSLAGYAQSGQEFRFYEIDPAVAKIARDQRYFTFLADAENRGANIRVVLGDGRLALEHDSDCRFGMIIIDAFSGDAIPVHLLTREAFQLYLKRLEEDGLLVIHISNDHVDLEPIVAELATDQNLVALIEKDLEIPPEEREHGKFGSTWVVLARRLEYLVPLAESKRWRPLKRSNSPILWRDDYTNLLPILRWN
jgi:hypothetical protein